MLKLVLPQLASLTPRLHNDTQPQARVRAGTIALAFANLSFILRFSTNTPVVDEWDLTHVVLGGMTLGEWTFTRLNEHLFPLANAAFFILMKLTNLDFRAGMIANLIVMTAACLLFQSAANHIRGHASLGDLFIPAALLNWGHAYNTLMCYQLAFGLFILSVAVVTHIIASAKVGEQRRTALRASIALIILMLNGGMGLAFVPPLALWILALCMCNRTWRPLPFVLMAGAYTASAMLGAPKVAAAPGEALGVGRIAWCVLQYLGMGTGLWYDGPHWPRNGIIIGAFTAVLGIISVIQSCIRRDGGRSAGMMMLFAAHGAVALGIAVSRGGGLAERYVTLSALGAVFAYLIIANTNWAVSRIASVSAIILFTINIAPGMDYGHRHRNLDKALHQDLQRGMPAEYLKDKYAVQLRVGDNLVPALQRLHDHGIRQFANLKRAQNSSLKPLGVIAFDTPLACESMPVEGLLIEYDITQPLAWCEVQLRFIASGSALTATVYPPRTPGRHQSRLWLNGRMDQAILKEIQQPAAIRLVSAAWIVPQE